MNEKKFQLGCILTGCFIYFGCLSSSMAISVSTLFMNWYEFEKFPPRSLFCYRAKNGSEIITVVFLGCGILTTLPEFLCLAALFVRVFGSLVCHASNICASKFFNKLLQFQMIFSASTTWFFFMALASFYILTPQRTVIEEMPDVHYDRTFQTSSHLTTFGDGFSYLKIAFYLSLVSLISSSLLETFVNHMKME